MRMFCHLAPVGRVESPTPPEIGAKDTTPFSIRGKNRFSPLSTWTTVVPGRSTTRLQILFKPLHRVLFIFRSIYFFAIGPMSGYSDLGGVHPPVFNLHEQTDLLLRSEVGRDGVFFVPHASSPPPPVFVFAFSADNRFCSQRTGTSPLPWWGSNPRDFHPSGAARVCFFFRVDPEIKNALQVGARHPLCEGSNVPIQPDRRRLVANRLVFANDKQPRTEGIARESHVFFPLSPQLPLQGPTTCLPLPQPCASGGDGF